MIDEIRRRALRSLIPPPRLDLAEWIEANLVLPAGVSALPGRVRLYPFQTGIARAISDPEIERVTLVKSVRVGLTTLLTGTIANYAINEPSPIMLLLPAEADCRDYVVSDLEPIFNATPALRGLLTPDGADDRSTLTSKRFPSGSLKVVPARAPRNLRRHNIRILLCDEVDGMEIGAEGNPIDLATRRTLSYSNRKIVIGSTPTIEETSIVLRSYEESDQRIFEVPCPDCGTFNQILWRNIEWQPRQPQTAAYRCPHCESLIAERHKHEMVAAGVWRVTRPEVRGHAGFHLNAFVSPLANATWGRLAAEFLQVKDDPSRLMVWVNTIAAQGWRETVEHIDESELQARAEPFGLPDRIPPEVLFVTAGTDVQHDRLETTLVGWTRDEILVLAHEIIWGAVHDRDVWIELDELLRTTWQHPRGGVLRVDAAIVDSADSTDHVYNFTRPRFARRIFAGRGVAGTRPIAEFSKSRHIAARLVLIGVDQAKAEIMTRLARGRSIRFSGSLAPAWYEQIVSEKQVLRYRLGTPVRTWQRLSGRSAEALDALAYAMAARKLVAVPLDRREAELAARTGLPPVMPTVIRSRWLDSRF